MELGKEDEQSIEARQKNSSRIRIQIMPLIIKQVSRKCLRSQTEHPGEAGTFAAQ